MPAPTSLRIAQVLALALAATASGACTAEEAPDVSTGTDDVTSIQRTSAKQQSIANCWLYATASWTESLHLRVSDEQLDVSEAYWSYFHWFDQLTDRSVTDYGYVGSLFPTGWWGTGVELMRRYGWMSETDFLPQDNGEIYSARQKRALETLQASLSSGALANPQARTDRALVIAELNRAWDLSPEVAEELTRVFGATYERTLVAGATAAGKVHAASSIPIGNVKDGDTSVVVTMADAIGEPAEGSRIADGARAGRFAWSQIAADADFASGGRALTLRAQKALNQNAPVWITWWADDARIAESGSYRVTASGSTSNGQLGGGAYLHASLIVDYQVDAPGFGVLPVGVPETRPEALEASLLPEANVQLFRVKNPWWGSYDLDGQRTAFSDGPGYHDVELDYLRLPSGRGETFLHSLILPNDEALVLGARE